MKIDFPYLFDGAAPAKKKPYQKPKILKTFYTQKERYKDVIRYVEIPETKAQKRLRTQDRWDATEDATTNCHTVYTRYPAVSTTTTDDMWFSTTVGW